MTDRFGCVVYFCGCYLDSVENKFVQIQVKERLKAMGALQPMNIFLRQEIDRMQKVRFVVIKKLSDWRLIIIFSLLKLAAMSVGLS